MRPRVIAFSVLLLLGACSEQAPPASQASPASNEAQAKIDAFFTAVTDRWVESNPDQAISTGYFSAFFWIFSRAASSRFTSSLSARRTR